eukprot:Blabericola_migrator_1__5188@NODE_2676_length_2475_cov_85_998754_g1649_i1_p2_GENE_NODE_2676_length_2475_cov_85_998754_g1649_i1NODE_2676_length_2475_cov_85_998754_g1649_i1_p2_ORF_typecomplete_len199_score11_66Rpr2/PF04032_16/9e06Rpr2/PF04032_16/2_4e02RNA_POL_M_15KD/PF02150_16/5_7_NODE_2676_length_2475_cov_85_998754_g1649_i118692465
MGTASKNIEYLEAIFRACSVESSFCVPAWGRRVMAEQGNASIKRPRGKLQHLLCMKCGSILLPEITARLRLERKTGRKWKHISRDRNALAFIACVQCGHQYVDPVTLDKCTVRNLQSTSRPCKRKRTAKAVTRRHTKQDDDALHAGSAFFDKEPLQPFSFETNTTPDAHTPVKPKKQVFKSGKLGKATQTKKVARRFF